MAEGHLQPMPALGRPPDRSDDGGVWGWVFVSGAAHAGVIALLLITPFLPSKAPIVPVYTVDLVGGEKLGSGAGTGFPSAPKEKPLPPPVPEVKETKKAGPSAAELEEAKRKAGAYARAEQAEKKQAAAAEMTERLAKAKREKEEKQKLAEEAEADKVREKLKQLRERRNDEALAEAEQKRREPLAQQQQQKQQQELQRLQQEAQERREQFQRLQQQQRDQQLRGSGGAPTSTVAGNNPGAAALGVGGTGGGIVKSAEFIRYQNIIKDRVKSSWTWPERRGADLKITVNVSIQPNGEITGVRLVGTSGDRSFDDSVVRAIRRASPLPSPPEDFRAEFLNVNVSFNSNDLGS